MPALSRGDTRYSDEASQGKYGCVSDGPGGPDVPNRRQCETARHYSAEWTGWVLSNIRLDREREESHRVHQRSNAHCKQNGRRYGHSEMGEQQAEDHQQSAHEQVVHMGLEELLVAGEHPL